MDFSRMVDFVDNQVTDQRLHHNCTKPEQCFLQSIDLVVDHLYLAQAHVDHAAMEKPLLLDLNQALVGDDVDTKVSDDPRWQEDDGRQPEASQQAQEEEADRRRVIGVQVCQHHRRHRTD